MDNVIPVGSNTNSRFCAYGDESRHKDILVYAYAGFDRENIGHAEKVVDMLRKEYKFPKRLPIHCRVLYNAEARRKCGLSHLNFEKVNKLIGQLINQMNEIPVVCRFAWTALTDKQPLVDSSDPEWRLPNEPKGIIGILMQGCFAVPADGSQGLPANETEIFVSADSTKIQFMGKKRYQAHRGYRGFSDIGAPTGEIFGIQPRVIPNDRWMEHPLLQVGDVFAYICSHIDQTMVRDDFYTNLLKSITYWSRATLILQPSIEPEK